MTKSLRIALAQLNPVLGDIPGNAALARKARAEAAAQGAEAPAATEEVVQAPVVKSDWDKTPRNAPCPCGSGKKFKLCHGA